ncbi:MAG: glycosyltransferase family 4 protein, partial [Chloroflexia bacterium]
FVESNYTMPSLLHPVTLLKAGVCIMRVIYQIVRLAHREHVDFIHANSAVAGVHSLPAAALLGLPCIVHAHDFNTAERTNHLLTFMMRYKRSAMIFVSRALAEHYKAAQQNYPYRVIHNAVDSDVYHPDANARSELLTEFGLPSDTFLIGAIGRLERWKGFDFVIRAFALVVSKHPQARLLIVGDVIFDNLKAYKQELKDLVDKLGLEDKVIFTGFRSDVSRVMSGIDLLAHCPVDREGFPMIMIEAMASARPIVTVPSGGTVEQVFDGVNGLIVPVRDVEATAEAVCRMMDDPQMAHRMGEAGLQMFLEELTVEKFASNIASFYNSFLRRDAARSTRETDIRVSENHKRARGTAG